MRIWSLLHLKRVSFKPARFGERGICRTWEEAKFDLISKSFVSIYCSIHWLVEFIKMWCCPCVDHVLFIASFFFSAHRHENNIGCNKSASNPEADSRAVNLSHAVGEITNIAIDGDRGCYFYCANPTKEDVPRFIFSDFSCNISSKFWACGKSESFDSRAHRSCCLAISWPDFKSFRHATTRLS